MKRSITALRLTRSTPTPTATATIVSQLSPFLINHFAPKFHPLFLLNQPSSSRSFHSSPVRGLAPAPAPPSAKELSTTSEKAVSTSSKDKGTRLQRIWNAVKKEAQHYWHGTRLLGKEIRISARIQGRLLAGKKLTRREHRQVSLATLSYQSVLLVVQEKLIMRRLPRSFSSKGRRKICSD